MANEGVLKTNDVIESGIFRDAIEGGKALEAQIKSIYATIEQKANVSQSFLSTFVPKNLNDIQKANAEIAKANVLVESRIKLETNEIKIAQQLEKLNQEKAKTTQANTKAETEKLKQIQLSTREQERQLKSLNALNGEYAKGTKALSEIKKQLKELEFTGQNNGKLYKALSQEFQTLDEKIRKAETSVGEFQRNVGNYPNAKKELQALLREMQNLEVGSKAFNEAAKKAGELRDRISDAKEAAKAFSSESKLGTAKELFSQMGSSLMNLDFKDAADKAKQFAAVVKSITFAEVIGGLKNLGTALLDVGKALLANPFTILVTAIVAAGLAIKNFYDSADAGLATLNELEKELKSVSDATEKLTNETRDLAIEQGVLNGTFTEYQAKQLKDAYKFRDEYLSILRKQREEVTNFNKKIQEERDDDSFKGTKRLYEALGGETELTRRQKKGLLEIQEKYNEQVAALQKKYEQERTNATLAETKKQDEEIKKRSDEAAKKLKEKRDKAKELQIEMDVQDEANRKHATDKLKNDLDEKQKAYDEASKKKHEKLIESSREEIEIFKDNSKKQEEIRQQTKATLDKIGQDLAAAESARAAKATEEIDRQIDKQSKAVERQQELADKGLKNQLAFEKQKAAQLELQREKEKEKEVRNQKIIAFYKLFAALAEKDPKNALAQATIDIAMAEVIAGAFKDGVEDLDGKGTETSDSNLALLSKGESVLTAKGTRETKGLATAINERGIAGVEEWTMKNILPNMEINTTGNNILASLQYQLLNDVKQGLNDVKTAIEKKEVTNIKLDNLGNIIETKIAQGIRTVVNHQHRTRL